MLFLLLCFPFDSAERIGVQPAAEPRHLQRHRHGGHVSGALRPCPATDLHSWALPARCLRRRRLPTPSRHPTPMPPSSYAPLSTRQSASAFNQPLSLDTSSIANMDKMFYVRSARALPPTTTVGFSLRAACAAATPRHPVSLPRTPPSSYTFVSTWQAANGLSDANKVLIRCALSGNAEFVNRYGSAWSGLGTCPLLQVATAAALPVQRRLRLRPREPVPAGCLRHVQPHHLV